MMKDVLLIVDDEIDLLTGLKRSVSNELNCTVLTATGGEEALQVLHQEPVDVILSDISMPGMDGITLLERIIEFDSDISVIMMTAYGSVDLAVKALKKGAYDFIQKPFEFDGLLRMLQKGFERNRLIRENKRMMKRICEQSALRELIGESEPMRRVHQMIHTLAQTDVTVLILGETGTGKELAANAIHEISRRRKRPLTTVNCPALPEGLLESELFGHKKGAFTGADNKQKGLFDQADGSTIFLDEIGDLPLALQTKLLRVLQNQEIRPLGAEASHRINVRLLAATNRDLSARIDTGEFRADLYYRLNVASLVMPSLNEIREDIPLLVNHFLSKSACELETEVKQVSPEVLALLKAREWPGNTRELENLVRSWTATIPGPVIQPEDLRLEPSLSDGTEIPSDMDKPYKTLKEKVIERFTREYVCRLLAKTGGNISLSAKISGIQRQSLQKIISRYQINVETYR